MKKKLTIEEIFEIEKNKFYNIRPVDDQKQNGFFAKFTIVGYMKNTNYLIGVLDENQGLSGNVLSPRGCRIINSFQSDKKYIYVNVVSLGKYPRNSTVVRKKERANIDDIEMDFK